MITSLMHVISVRRRRMYFRELQLEHSAVSTVSITLHRPTARHTRSGQGQANL